LADASPAEPLLALPFFRRKTPHRLPQIDPCCGRSPDRATVASPVVAGLPTEPPSHLAAQYTAPPPQIDFI